MWKSIEGYEGFYEISDTGEVRSLDRILKRKDNKPYTAKGQTMKIKNFKSGYEYVTLASTTINKGKNKKFLIHRLVAMAFIPNPENKPFVNHIDGIKNNNRVENLEWVTRVENAQHAVKNGLYNHVVGEASGTAKLTEKQVLEILDNYDGSETLQVIANRYTVCVERISRILTGDSWSYLGRKSKEKKKMTRLTEKQVIEIIEKGKCDTYAKISGKYNCSEETIRNILLKKSWKHIHSQLEKSNDHL